MKRDFIIFIILILVLAVGGVYYSVTRGGDSTEPIVEEPTFCTADAMQCPDGSWVGRTGANCEFVCSN
jgi:hypothetical protein